MLERLIEPYRSQQRTPSYYFKCFISGYSSSTAYVQNSSSLGNDFGDPTSVDTLKKWSSRNEYSVNRIFTQILSGGIRFGFYQIFKRFYNSYFSKWQWTNYAMSAASAQFLAVSVSLPFVNIRIVKERYLSIEQLEQIRATTDQAVLRQIIQDDPVSSKQHYRGYFHTLLKNIPYTVICFTSFQMLSEFWYTKILETPKEQYCGINQVLFSMINGLFSGVLYYNISQGFKGLQIPILGHASISFGYYATSSALLFGVYNLMKILLNSETLGGKNTPHQLH